MQMQHAVMQVAVEVHEVGDRPAQVEAILQSAGLSCTACKGTAPHTQMIYAH